MASFANAQITNGSLSGKVINSKNEPLSNVELTLLFESTGTIYRSVSNEKGLYSFYNLNIGGPYTLTATLQDYEKYTKNDISINLGESLELKIELENSGKSRELEGAKVVIKKEAPQGSDLKLSKEQLQQLPTISRSIGDLTRLTPQSSNNSFAGANFRYNNISVDGAINNDAIGFSPSLGGMSGTSNMPGSSTRSNAISMDAIQDMSVSIAPYDVKIGNFTGGSINAVTRRGTNKVSVSVYSFARNAAITGRDNVGDGSKMPSSYYDYQTGFRVGMPLVKDKLFLFANYEKTDRSEPLFYGAGSQGTFMTTAIAQGITDSLNSKTFMPANQYNPKGTYNPGAYTSYNIYSRSQKFFTRLDWNINEKNQLTLRNNFVPSSSSNLEWSNSQFQFGNYDFIQKNINNSTVMELKTKVGTNASNSFIAGFTSIQDSRNPTGNEIAPQIQINNVNGGGTILLGTNREAAIFNMKQKTLELTDNFNFTKGKHAVTLGTHNELYQIDYGFINSWNGRIDYNSLTDFYNNKPARIRGIYNVDDNTQSYNLNNPVAKFNVYMLSLYGQDEIKLTDKFKLTAGLRFDMNLVDHAPNTTSTIANAQPGANYGTTYGYTPLTSINNKIFGQPIVSPRIGFNYDVLSDKKLVVRGGSGVFSGRIPFAWLGYAYYNNGVNFGAFDYKNAPANTHIPTDPTQFTAYNTNVLKQPNRYEIDVIDNNFKMPRVWRSNLATDIKIPGGVKLTLEGIYTKKLYDVLFKQVNLKDSVTYASYDVNHQQPIYLSGGSTGQRINNQYSSAYMLSNTNKGYSYQLTTQASKAFDFGLNLMVAYTYAKSYDMSNGIRNSFESNWQLNQSLVANNPQLAYSNFDIRHRIVSTLSYKKEWNKNYSSYINFVFTDQSGSPFTWVVNSNKVTNSGQQIDLAYIPNDATKEMKFQDMKDGSGNVIATAAAQAQAYNDFVNSDPYLSSRKGNFTERNGARTPWNKMLDVRMMQDFNFYDKDNKKHTLTITLDIMNFTNLLNKNWGYAYFVPNTLNQSASIGLNPVGTDANHNPIFNFVKPTTAPYSTDKLSSRWQGQLGVRYTF